MTKKTVAIKKAGTKKLVAPTKKKELPKSNTKPKAKAKKVGETVNNKKLAPAKSSKTTTKTTKKVIKKSPPQKEVIKSKPKVVTKVLPKPKTKATKEVVKPIAKGKNVKQSIVQKAITKKEIKPTSKSTPSKTTPSKTIASKTTSSKTVDAKKNNVAKKASVTKTTSKKAEKAIQTKPVILAPPVATIAQIPDKKPKIKNVLISQAYPENGKSPFLDIAVKWKLKVDFRSFIQVEGVTAKEFRRLRINIPEFSAIIFNSRNAIDYFFKLCEEMRVKLSQDTKYFCTSEAIALYLQKYIHYRKRKVFYEYPNKTLFEILNKHKENEKFLYPCSIDRKDDIPNFLQQKKFNYAEAPIYQTIPSDLSDLKSIRYDVIIFFSPVGIKSLMHNYPDFVQEDRRIGGFGQVTHDAVRESGFRLDIVAPSNVAPSMAQALENYLRESNGKPA
jgi:uroporphyrinogen-III synthase